MAAASAPSIVIAPFGAGSADGVTIKPDEPAVIGRADDCRIHVPDRHISLQHARVRYQDGSWCVTDLESRNGTCVNRWKLAPNDPVRLHDGDVITVGPCRLTVTLGDASPAGPAGPASLSGTYATHGSMFHRAPGSIGQSAFPSKVLRGMRGPGQMGNVQVKCKNVKIVRVDTEKNLLLVRGSVPGSRGSMLLIRRALSGK